MKSPFMFARVVGCCVALLTSLAAAAALAGPPARTASVKSQPASVGNGADITVPVRTAELDSREFGSYFSDESRIPAKFIDRKNPPPPYYAQYVLPVPYRVPYGYYYAPARAYYRPWYYGYHGPYAPYSAYPWPVPPGYAAPYWGDVLGAYPEGVPPGAMLAPYSGVVDPSILDSGVLNPGQPIRGAAMVPDRECFYW